MNYGNNWNNGGWNQGNTPTNAWNNGGWNQNACSTTGASFANPTTNGFNGFNGFSGLNGFNGLGGFSGFNPMNTSFNANTLPTAILAACTPNPAASFTFATALANALTTSGNVAGVANLFNATGLGSNVNGFGTSTNLGTNFGAAQVFGGTTPTFGQGYVPSTCSTYQGQYGFGVPTTSSSTQNTGTFGGFGSTSSSRSNVFSSSPSTVGSITPSTSGGSPGVTTGTQWNYAGSTETSTRTPVRAAA